MIDAAACSMNFGSSEILSDIRLIEVLVPYFTG